MAVTTYAVALGSNRRGRAGSPERILAAALAELRPVAASRIVRSAPVGPSSRRFANAVALVKTREDPPALLARYRRLERAAGRRPGRRWGARVLDLDLVLWSGGAWRSPGVRLPHPAFRKRAFVLGPLAEVAPRWRDPATGLTVRQLVVRLARARPVDPRRPPA